MIFLAGGAGVIHINGTVIVELITVLNIMAVLSPYVYPGGLRRAEARPRPSLEQAIQAVRGEVAGLVVAATEKVIGETLDLTKHKQLIDRAIQEVASGDGSRRSGS